MFSQSRPAGDVRPSAPRTRGAAGGLVAAVLLALALITGCSASTDASAPTAVQPLTLVDSPSTTSPLAPEQAAPEPAAPEPAIPEAISPGLAPVANAQLFDPAAGVTTVSASTPVRIQIPSIGVDSDLIGLGLQPDGTMEVPAGGFPGGWYTGSPTPGEMGPSIIAGHVDMNGSPGIFYRLREMNSGDSIVVSRADGSVVTFAVSDVEQYPKSDFPTGSVYGDIDHAGLRLITCGGDFDSGASSYDDNIVVYAGLVT